MIKLRAVRGDNGAYIPYHAFTCEYTQITRPEKKCPVIAFQQLPLIFRLWSFGKKRRRGRLAYLLMKMAELGAQWVIITQTEQSSGFNPGFTVIFWITLDFYLLKS